MLGCVAASHTLSLRFVSLWSLSYMLGTWHGDGEPWWCRTPAWWCGWCRTRGNDTVACRWRRAAVPLQVLGLKAHIREMEAAVRQAVAEQKAAEAL